MFTNRKLVAICFDVGLSVFVAGCRKKVPAPPPPPPPAPAARLSVDPASIQRGQSATLNWQVTGESTSVSINQGVGTVQATGSQRVQPTNTTTYTLTATGPGGSNTATATLTVIAPPPVVASFTADPASIQRGQSSTLNWQVTGEATSISINQGVGTVQATGNSRVQPDNSTTYTLTKRRLTRGILKISCF